MCARVRNNSIILFHSTPTHALLLLQACDASDNIMLTNAALLAIFSASLYIHRRHAFMHVYISSLPSKIPLIPAYREHSGCIPV